MEPNIECRDYPELRVYHHKTSTTVIRHDDATPSTVASPPANDASLDQLQKRAVWPTHRATDVITRDSNIFNGRRSSLRHVTRQHVTRRKPIFATCHSSTRHSSSTHCQRRYNIVDATLRSVEPPSVPGRPLFDRLVSSVRHAVARITTSTGSTTVNDS